MVSNLQGIRSEEHTTEWVIDTPPKTWTRALAFRRDGSLMAAGTSDGVIRLIDPADGRVLGQVSGSRDEVFGIAFRRDGRVLAAGSMDRAVRFWDPDARTELGSVAGLPARALQVMFAPDDATVIAAGDDGVHLLDSAAFRDLGLLPGSAPSWGLALSPDGRWLAAGGNDSVIRLWDFTAEGRTREPRLLRGHKRLIAGLAFSPDSSILVSGSDDATIRLWDTRTANSLATVESGRGEVSHVACSPDGRRIAAACQGNAVVIVDLHHFEPHIAGNLTYRLDRHRADLPEGSTPDHVRAGVLNQR